MSVAVVMHEKCEKCEAQVLSSKAVAAMTGSVGAISSAVDMYGETSHSGSWWRNETVYKARKAAVR